MKTSTLEKPIVNEMLPLTEAISKQFLQLAHDHIVKPADFDNAQGLTIRDDILMLTRKPLPKELRKVLIEAGIVVDNLMYRTAGKGGIFEDNVMYKNGDKARIIEDYLMYLTAGIVEDNAMFLTSVIIRDDIMLNAVPGTKPGIFVDNLVYLYKKPTTDPLQTGNPQYIVVTGAVARIMENAKAGTVIRDDVMLRNSAQGSMIAMPIHHFGPRKNQQNLFLVAVQQNGAAAPKVGRVRAKFDSQGRIESVSWTNAENKKAGLPNFEEIWISRSGQKSAERKVGISLDGIAFPQLNEWDLDIWTRVVGK